MAQTKTRDAVSGTLLKALHDGQKTVVEAGRTLVKIGDETISALLPVGIMEKLPKRTDTIDAVFDAIEKMFTLVFDYAGVAASATEAAVLNTMAAGNGHAPVEKTAKAPAPTA